jgi:hypothetical protein
VVNIYSINGIYVKFKLSIIGSKSWPVASQIKIWDWIKPQLPKILGQNVKSDTLNIWTSFLEVKLSIIDSVICPKIWFIVLARK